MSGNDLQYQRYFETMRVPFVFDRHQPMLFNFAVLKFSRTTVQKGAHIYIYTETFPNFVS